MVTILRKRFQGSITLEQRLLELNSVEQLPWEGVRDYAVKCRRLGELKTPKSSSVEEASWRLIDQLLSEIKGDECLVYLDDIIVYSANIEEHCQRLGRVLARLNETYLQANLEKCHFAQSEVHYLGHIVSSEGVRPDPKKVDAVVEYPVPRTTKDVKAFLGLAGYYRRFVPGFSNLAKPLTIILRKNEKFHWGDAQRTSFEAVKGALCSQAVLIYPDLMIPLYYQQTLWV
ncbi:uncharacterized protein [Halyomorpha halys]|uniref:uncharacterized protein n=1 Tax=Halyomorpha halys TaxID=286706 RepID=UPI0034D2E2BB